MILDKIFLMKKKILQSLVFIFAIHINAQEQYYDDVDLNLTGVSLKEELAIKITNTHTNYLDYTPGVWEASKVTDVNPEDNTEVVLLYGWEDGSDSTVNNDRTRGIDDNGGNTTDWNREHSYPKSLGNPNLGETGPGSDAHHLRPCDPSRNSTRSNNLYGNGSGTESYTTSSGDWYPGDEWKGDVARMMMYMYLRYDDRCLPSGVGVGDNSGTPDDMIDLFLDWNAEDPVSDFEKTRNTYHEETNNTYAQGNRNPFIDNPHLATRIWGGTDAEDTWGIYTSSDAEAPTAPTNLALTNETTFSIDASWTASTDNVAVTSYDIYVDNELKANTSNTNYSIIDLTSNESYDIYIIAKDIANNESLNSNSETTSTLEDTDAPSTPINIISSSITDISFKISWDASTDNTAVTNYDIYIDGSLEGSTSETIYTVTNLTESTTYTVSLTANDAVNNYSSQSTPIDVTTNDSASNSGVDLFFSEYVEGSSNNKALEIANATGQAIDLSAYSIKRQSAGGQDGEEWSTPALVLSGTLNSSDVYVLINASATLQNLIDNADFVQPNNSDTNYGEPLNFNGNDPVGLFKNDALIDIIGDYNGGSANFAKDVTLRRKSNITSPNVDFDLVNEWDSYSQDTVDNIGTHDFSNLSVSIHELNSISVYPNPTKGDILNINTQENLSIEIYSVLGKGMLTGEVSKLDNKIDIAHLQTGIYFIKLSSEDGNSTRKLIKH